MRPSDLPHFANLRHPSPGPRRPLLPRLAVADLATLIIAALLAATLARAALITITNLAAPIPGCC